MKTTEPNVNEMKRTEPSRNEPYEWRMWTKNEGTNFKKEKREKVNGEIGENGPIPTQQRTAKRESERNCGEEFEWGASNELRVHVANPL